MSITSADLRIVYRTTYTARNKWKNILLELEVSSAAIDSIAVRCRDNPDDCYREGLREWLEGGERNWRDLVEALSSPTVGHRDVTMAIKRDYLPESPSTDSITLERAIIHPNHQKINDSLIIVTNEKLGSGAFGVVFKGSYQNSPCAVKVLHEVALQLRTNLPAGQRNETAAQAFDRECEFLKSFQHPNIVQHLSTDKHPMSGNTILVTELMDCNLRSYLCGINEESLTSHCQVSLSTDVASGLAYLHSKRIIHRDFCGDNILLTLSQPVPAAKISDFGMSRLLDSSQMSHTLTAVGHRMGYLPPEALRLEDEEYDHSLDVFSLGVIMVQIALKLETVKTVKDRSFHVSQIPTSHRLKQVISDCLQEDKRRRPTAEGICEDLMVKKKLIKNQDCLSQELTPPLTLKWRRGKNMPIKMSSKGQSVVISHYVYVGGGDAYIKHYMCTVMKLDLQRDEWTKLPKHSFQWFAMTSLNNQLVLVGGHDPVTQKPTNQTAVFESGKWTHPYPPMNIARDCSTAVCFNNHIIVAGGHDDQYKPTSSVEVLDVTSRTWFIAESLPHPRSMANSTLLGNTFYLMGKYDYYNVPMTLVLKVDLNELIRKAVSKQATPTLWQAIEDTPLKHSAPLSVGGSLLAVGGRDDHYNPSSSIHLYQPDTRRWVEVGDLPTARYYCTCSVLPSGEIIVAGGQNYIDQYIDTVYFLSISNTD